MKPARISSSLAFAVLCASLAWSAGAGAAYLNIPALGMSLAKGTAALNPSFGLLDADGQSGVYTAPVHIPAGQLVCRVILVARDYDSSAQNMTVRLYRKLLGAAASFGATPYLMAMASSSGASDGIRLFTDTTVGNRTISASYVYWVELEFFDLGFYQALAIRIEYKATCP